MKVKRGDSKQWREEQLWSSESVAVVVTKNASTTALTVMILLLRMMVVTMIHLDVQVSENLVRQ